MITTEPSAGAEYRAAPVTARPLGLADAIRDVFEDLPLECLTPPAARLVQGLRRRVIGIVTAACRRDHAEDMQPAQRPAAATAPPAAAPPVAVESVEDEFALPVAAFRQDVAPSLIEPLAVRSDQRCRAAATDAKSASLAAHEHDDVENTPTAGDTLPSARQWTCDPAPPASGPDADDPVRSALREAAVAAILTMRAAATASRCGAPMEPDAKTESSGCPPIAACSSAMSRQTACTSPSKSGAAVRTPKFDGGTPKRAGQSEPPWDWRRATRMAAAHQNMSHDSATQPTAS